MKAIRTLATLVCISVGSAIAVQADVKTEQKGQVKVSGALGRMFSMFGGKAAREGVVTRVAVKGDRMLTTSGDNGQLIDLAEEKVYDISFGNKSYKVTTFEELRRRMREAEEKARQNQAKAEERQDTEKNGDTPPEYQVDVATKSTGATRTINGFDTRQAITTITVRQKGKTIEQGGGLVLTADSWVTSRIDAMKEVADFQRRYMQKLESPMMGAMSAEQMAAVFAMYPMMKEAMGRVRTEGEKVEGTQVLTTITCDAVQDPTQAQAKAEESKGEGAPTSVGGLGGMFARKMMKKKAEDSAASDTTPGRATVMTMVSETLSVSNDVAAGDVAVPAGFEEKS